MNLKVARRVQLAAQTAQNVRITRVELEYRIASLEHQIRLWRSAIGFMQQYNGRSVQECLELAKKHLA